MKDINSYLDIFDNPRNLFQVNFKSINKLKDTCIFILDTNVLLLPYTIGNKELHEIEKVYKILLNSNKLLVPSQVAKEFVKNRPKKLEEINKSISDYLSTVKSMDIPKYPMFGKVQDYLDILELENVLNEKIKNYKAGIKNVLKYVKNINWNDPVSTTYSSLFSEDYIVDNSWDYKVLKDELEARHKFNIPPAYKDKGKTDGGIGDYIIWKDIQKIALDNDSDIVFVTGDEKADWFHQSMNSKLYPRFELLYEFKENTKGRDFSIISLADLIELYSDNSEVVDSIRTVETVETSRLKRVRRQRFLRNLVIHRADGTCELCGKKAPFISKKGTPYLEIHHIKPLSDGGEETADNVIALCPNCHRMVEYGDVSIKSLLKIRENEFKPGSPCEMSGQICPSCKIGLTYGQLNVYYIQI